MIDSPNDEITLTIHRILINARLPLWLTSTSTLRSSHQKLISQSMEYFRSRCFLTTDLTEEQQKLLDIDVKLWLKQEFNWLSTYEVTSTPGEQRTIDDILILGHLKFSRTLFTCEGIDKKIYGSKFISLLLDEYLFPAAKKIIQPLKTKSMENNEFSDHVTPEPKCFTNESRDAAYAVLVELVKDCQSNLQIVVEQLIQLHHTLSLEKQTEWDVRFH